MVAMGRTVPARSVPPAHRHSSLTSGAHTGTVSSCSGHREGRGARARAATVVLLGSILAGVAANWGAAAASGAATASPVPAAYQAAYDGVRSELADFTGQVSRSPAYARTTVGAELLTANGNIGTALLSPRALQGVTVELDAFQRLGVEGVTVDVSYPLLLPTTSEHSGYLSFYESVAREVRRHHMVLSVEENPVFVGTPLTSLDVSYAGLTLQSYAQGERQEAQLIVDDLRPAYLTVLSEPDTFTDALGVNVDTPASAVELVQSELRGLRRGAHRWEPGRAPGAVPPSIAPCWRRPPSTTSTCTSIPSDPARSPACATTRQRRSRPASLS